MPLFAEINSICANFIKEMQTKIHFSRLNHLYLEHYLLPGSNSESGLMTVKIEHSHVMIIGRCPNEKIVQS